MNYKDFVANWCELAEEQDLEYWEAASQLISSPTKIGPYTAFVYFVSEEFGGGERVAPNVVIQQSEVPIEADRVRNDLIGSAVEVLATDLEAAYNEKHSSDRADYALVKGMAVTSDEHGTGEIIKTLDKDLGDGTPPGALVEFGDIDETVGLSEIDVDWEFYRDGTSVHRSTG